MRKYHFRFVGIFILVCTVSFAVLGVPQWLNFSVLPSPIVYAYYVVLGFGALAVLTIYLAIRLAIFFSRVLDRPVPSTLSTVISTLILFLITLMASIAVLLELFFGLFVFSFGPAAPTLITTSQGKFWVSPGFPDDDSTTFHRAIGLFLMDSRTDDNEALRQAWNDRSRPSLSPSPSPSPSTSDSSSEPSTPSPSPTLDTPTLSTPTPFPSDTSTPSPAQVSPRQQTSDTKGACTVSVEETNQGSYQAVWGTSGSALHTVPVQVSYRELKATCVTDTVAIISWTDLQGAYLLITTDAGVTWNTPNLPDPDGVGAYGHYFKEATGTDTTISILLDYPDWEPASTGGWWFVSIDNGHTWTRR